MPLNNPSALWLLPLVGVLLLLFRFRNNLPRRAVSNWHLWHASRADDQVRLAPARLRLNWTLVLQTAFMLAVIAAVARPVLISRSRHVTLVFDVSASMGASDAAATRLDAARTKAAAILASLASSARVHIVTAGPVAADAGEFGADERALQRAIDGLQPTAGTANIAEAVELARVLGGPDHDIFVLSDGTQPSGIRAVHWVRVGRPADNLAITALAARRLPDQPRDGQVLVEVFNYGSVARDTEVEFTQDDRVVARQSVGTRARSAETLTIAVHDIAGSITARLAGNRDALAVDDRRSVIVPSLSPVRVQLVTAGNFFLEKALAANPALLVDVATHVEISRPPDVIVCDGCRSVPEGDAGVLMLAPAAADLSAAVPLTVSMRSHPVAAALDTQGAAGIPSKPVAAARGGEVVLRAGGEPAVIAYEQGGRRIVEMDLDVTPRAALPFTTAFPVLIANAVEWLSAAHERPTEVVAGEPLHWVMRNSQRSSPLSVVTPGGRTLPQRPGGRDLAFTLTDVPGVYTVRDGNLLLRFAVNPATATESDLMTADAATAGQSGANPPTLATSSTELKPWLLVLAVCLLAIDWRYSSAHRTTTGALVTRSVIATLLLAGATGVRLPVGQGRAVVVFAIDQSGSLGIAARRQAIAEINQMMAKMRPDDRAGIVVFGSDAAVERRPSPAAAFIDATSRVGTTATNIESALRLSRAVLPREGMRRIVLVSDGRETVGEAVSEAARADADDVRIDVLLPQAPLRDVRPLVARSVTAPEDVRVGEPFLVSAEFEGAPGASGRATILRDGVATGSRDVAIGSDGTGTLTWSERPLDAGLRLYEAAIHTNDDEADRPQAGTTVSVSGETRLLYVGRGEGAVSAALDGAGFRITRVSPGDLPASVSALATYSAVVLDDVAADSLKVGQASAVAQYVEEGGGLLMLGSARALDAAAYSDGPLGTILPVDLRPRSGRRAPPMAFVLVFDKSGSMADRAGGVQKIELARQAVMKVLAVLPSGDPFGVIAFDGAPTVVAPLAVSHEAAVVAERLRRIEPRGSTAIAPAIDIALKWLRTANVTRRHVLLVSDGRTSPSDADRLRAAVRGQNVEISVVAIGPDAERGLLGRLAADTGGRAFFPDDIRDLPSIVAREAARSSGGARVDEEFIVRAASHPVLTGINRTSLPRLRGYVVAAPKPGADLILTSHLDDPVLAAWRYGLGSVGVLTSDMRSPWAEGMVRWAGFRQLWRQTIRWLSRRAASGALRATLLDANDGPRLVVEARGPDGAFASQLDVRAAIRTPNGDMQAVVLRATAPGRYEGTIAAPDTGPYAATIVSRDGQTGREERVLRGLYWSADRERIGRGVDRTALARLARITGGEELTAAGNPFGHARPAERRDVSAWLSAAALVLFLADIARRRGIGVALARRAISYPRASSFAASRD